MGMDDPSIDATTPVTLRPHNRNEINSEVPNSKGIPASLIGEAGGLSKVDIPGKSLCKTWGMCPYGHRLPVQLLNIPWQI